MQRQADHTVSFQQSLEPLSLNASALVFIFTTTSEGRRRRPKWNVFILHKCQTVVVTVALLQQPWCVGLVCGCPMGISHKHTDMHACPPPPHTHTCKHTACTAMSHAVSYAHRTHTAPSDPHSEPPPMLWPAATVIEGSWPEHSEDGGGRKKKWGEGRIGGE